MNNYNGLLTPTKIKKYNKKAYKVCHSPQNFKCYCATITPRVHVRRESMSNQQAGTRKGFSILQCKAITTCHKAIQNTETLAKQIDEMLNKMKFEEFIYDKFGQRLAKHNVFDIVFSGCPNGCSRPQINDIGIMARAIIDVNHEDCIACMRCVEKCKENALVWDGTQILFDIDQCIGCGDCVRVCPTSAIQQMINGYRIIAGGRLGRHPQLAIEIIPFIEEDLVVDAVRGLIEYFMENAKKEERLADLIGRLGKESIYHYIKKAIEARSA